jgi:hypothetical protein
MTVEKLQERINTLQASKDQMLANANAFSGAIQECRFWLAQLLAEQEPPKE